MNTEPTTIRELEEFGVPAGTQIQIEGVPFLLGRWTVLKGVKANLALTSVKAAPNPESPEKVSE